jgi:fibronectin-binding autotransporter adhesin
MMERGIDMSRTRVESRTVRRWQAGRLAVGVGIVSLLGGVTTLAGSMPAGAVPTNLYVSSYGSNSGNNCKVQSTPCQTLTYAYNHSASGETINLASGTYTVNALQIIDNISIVGVDSGGSLSANTTTISANGNEFGLIIEGTDSLTNVVVNDATNESIYNDGGSLTLTNVILGSNTGGFNSGAGLAQADGGIITMNGGSITGNTDDDAFGGAGFVNNVGTATFNNVTFTQNHDTSSTGEGGAILNYRGTVHLKGTTNLHNNTSLVNGGGIENCSADGAVITFGPDVVNTGNTPNDLSNVDLSGVCS